MRLRSFDGANRLTILFRIIMPNAGPVLRRWPFLALLGIGISSWNH
ncbi:MAG: hypothetical protein R2867_09870 [Caldilineaceae bacterium]